MDANKKAMLRNIRQALVVTLVLLLLCGFVFPVLLSGLSGLLFPHQAGGSLVTADGKAVGAKLVGQEFTEAYFMKGRPSAYHYNTYYTDEQGSRFYNDGSEFAGLGSGSNNYAPSNPALTQRVEADIEAFLAENPGVAREDIPADLMTASGSGLDPHISPAAAQVQLPAIAEASGLSPERLAQIVADNTEEKLLGVFGEETVNVLGVNLDIALAMGLISETENKRGRSKKRRPNGDGRLLYTAARGAAGVTSPGRAASTALARQQLLMGSAFRDLAVVDVHDFVAGTDGGEPVCDNEGGASLEHAVHTLLQLAFRFGIHAAGGFVQDEDLRVGRHGARQSKKLLSPWESMAPPSVSTVS